MAISEGAAILGGSAISAGSSLLGGMMGGKSSDKEAKAARRLMERQEAEAMRQQRLMYDDARADMAPWRDHGIEAIRSLWSKVKDGPGDFQASPSYQFVLDEGTKALDRSAAARGALGTGAHSKDLMRFGQGQASKEYDNFLTRYYQSLAPLQSMAGLGQTATGATQQAGMNMANQSGNILMNSGNARASMYMNEGANRANANNSMIQGVGNAVQGGLNNYLFMKALGGGS